ncbi:CoA transferase [Fulvimarina endophytica]|uniref:CoA transferase n=1 Tax=Fulvimarina endophytica TaxID=2293836 RepID=A0A371WZV5_9HYPH|nr:CoA transferase [Fulvimarina endophytica]RFC62304.1 CoA transferase [Fulvimarina endophytica]
MNADSDRLPLEGIRVIDVSQVMAGPFACMLLGDLGADVIKVEPPTGDQTRSSMGFKLQGDDSLGFINLNRNKRSIVLDLKAEEDRNVFFELSKTADVIIENYRPGVMKKLGIDYDAISKINPKIIYASISGFGQTGPWWKRPGFDLMAQAASGVMSITGHPDSPPAKSGAPLADIGCALFTVYAVLSAFIGREKSGKGQYIDASLYEAGLSFAIWDICNYWGTGTIPERTGTANQMAAPYQAVRAKDGYFVLGANNDRMFAKLCDLLDRSDLVDHPDYSTNALRLKNRIALIEELETVLLTRTREDWVETLLAAGIPAGSIQDYSEALGNPHAEAREMVMPIDHPVEGRVNNIGFPVKLRGTPQQVRRHPPLLNEHRDEILAELGLGPSGKEANNVRSA